MRPNLFERRPLLMCQKLEDLLSGGPTVALDRFVSSRGKPLHGVGVQRLQRKR